MQEQKFYEPFSKRSGVAISGEVSSKMLSRGLFINFLQLFISCGISLPLNVSRPLPAYAPPPPWRWVATPLPKLQTFVTIHSTIFSRSVAERFDLGKSSLSHSVFRVMAALNSISNQIIKWPEQAEMPEIIENFRRKGNLPNIIGAIDGTHIFIKGPKVILRKKLIFEISFDPFSYYNRNPHPLILF